MKVKIVFHNLFYREKLDGKKRERQVLVTTIDSFPKDVSLMAKIQEKNKWHRSTQETKRQLDPTAKI